MADFRATPLSRWRGFTDAARFLLLLRTPRADAAPAVRADAMIRWFVPLGIVIGLTWVGTFRATWRLYGEINGLRIVPALAVLLLEAFVTGRFLSLGAARAADQMALASNGSLPSSTPFDVTAPLRSRGTLVLMLVLLATWVMVASLPVWTAWWPPPGDWRSRFNILYPRPIYRPLFLAPLWGRWAILLAASLGRAGISADPFTAAFCSRVTPSRILLHGVLPIILSCIYFSREQNFLYGGVIGLIVFAVSYLASVYMTRRLGGQTRETLFAAGQIGQLTFLVAYRAIEPSLYL